MNSISKNLKRLIASSGIKFLILSSALLASGAEAAGTPTYCTGTFGNVVPSGGGKGSITWYNPINGYYEIVSTGTGSYNSGAGTGGAYNGTDLNAVAQDPATGIIYYIDRGGSPTNKTPDVYAFNPNTGVTSYIGVLSYSATSGRRTVGATVKDGNLYLLSNNYETAVVSISSLSTSGTSVTWTAFNISTPQTKTAFSGNGDIAVDSTNNVWLTYDATIGGTKHTYIAKLNSDGSLTPATDTGMPSTETVQGISFDPIYNVFYIATASGKIYKLPYSLSGLGLIRDYGSANSLADLGSCGTAAATPALSKAFDGATSKSISIDPATGKATTVLSITVQNNNLAPIMLYTGITDNLPKDTTTNAQLSVASTPNYTAICKKSDGTTVIPNNSGFNSLSYQATIGGTTQSAPPAPLANATSWTLPANTIIPSGTCTFSFSVNVPGAGTYSNTIPAGSQTSAGDLNKADATLTAVVPPVITLKKALGSTGRIVAADQFTVEIRDSAGTVLNATTNSTTTGSGTTVTGGTTGTYTATADTAYTLAEKMSGAAGQSTLTQYANSVACTNTQAVANGGTDVSGVTTLTQTITPKNGDVISCTITNTPKAKSNLSISKTDNQSAVGANSIATYRLRVINNGPSSVSDAILKDSVIAGLTVDNIYCITFSPSNGNTCTASTTPTATNLVNGYTLPALANGAFYEIAVAVVVNAAAGSVFTNTATVSSTSTVRTDGTVNSVTATDTDTVNNVTPFASCPSEAFIGRGPDSYNIGLYSLGLNDGSMPQLGTGVLPVNANGLGFSQADGFIYGWGNSLATPRLVKIGQNGAWIPAFGTVPVGFPANITPTFYIADIQPSTGYYVGAYSGKLYFIDVVNNKLMSTISLSPSTALDDSTDIAFNPKDGFIYSVNKTNRQLIRIDPATGTAITIEIGQQNPDGTITAGIKIPDENTLPVGTGTTGGFGGIFFDSLGTMYAYKSGSGGSKGILYTIYNPYDPGNPTNPKPSWAKATETLTASNLDGARCPMAPPPYAPLKVTKTITGGPMGGASTDLLFNFSVICDAPKQTYSGSVTVPSGSTTKTITLSNTIPLNSAGCKVAEDTSALPTATGYTWGTPTYTPVLPAEPNPTTSDKIGFITNTSNSELTITNPLIPNPDTLSITKTTPTPYIKYVRQADGTFKPDDITYTITVTSSGITANNVVVTDTLPAGLTNITVKDSNNSIVTLKDTSGTTVVNPVPGPTTSSQKIVWNAGNVAVGTPRTYTVTATPPSAATLEATQPQTAIVNAASAKGDNTTQADSSVTSQTIYTKLFKQVHNLGNAATASSPAVPASSPAWSGSGTGLPGDVLEYCIDFYNYGSTSLKNYKVSDDLPKNTEYLTGSTRLVKKTMSNVTGDYVNTPLAAPAITPTASVAFTAATTSAPSGTVTASNIILNPGESGSMCFRATIK